MPGSRAFLVRLLFLLLALLAVSGVRAEDSLLHRQWKIDGVTREALVYPPARDSAQPAPVLFVFHGHGGTMANAAGHMPYHALWPQAIVVFPQGLNTPGQLTDPQGLKTGWQKLPGDMGDRDLKFFDAILASLRKDYSVDDHRIYVTGHSNGGGFTYLLWAARGDTLAAVAPTSAAALRLRGQLRPLPAFISAGQSDPLVKFAWQQMAIDSVLALDQCGPGEQRGQYLTFHPSKIGTPVETYIHPGGHQFPPEAAPLIVKFFQSCVKK